MRGLSPLAHPVLRDHGWKGIDPWTLVSADVTAIGDRVFVPYKLPDGTTHNVRMFGTGRPWWFRRGRRLIPFGLETLPTGDRCRTHAVLVAEGESDCLALREAFAGTTADHPISGISVIALPGAMTWQPGWKDYIRRFPLIYVIGDGDAPGRSMMAAVRRTVPWARLVSLEEGEDARNVIQSRGVRALDSSFLDADRIYEFEVALRCLTRRAALNAFDVIGTRRTGLVR